MHPINGSRRGHEVSNVKRPRKCKHLVRAVGCCLDCGAGEQYDLDSIEALAFGTHVREAGELVEVDAGELLLIVDTVRRLEGEVAMLRQATTRVVEIDEFNCPHNTEISADGTCGTCGGYVP